MSLLSRFVVAFLLVICLAKICEIGIVENKASAQSGNVPEQQQQSSPAQNPQASPTGSALPVGQTNSDQSDRGKAGQSGQQNQTPADSESSWLTDWAQVGINFALLLFVAFQTLIYLHQRDYMKKQIESAEVTERAYVGVADMTISDLEVGKRPTVTVKWVNGGRTPAMNFRAMPMLKFGNEPTTNVIGFIDDDVKAISTSFIPAGAEKEIPYRQNHVVTAENLDEFQRGKVNIYILGNLYYRDIRGVRHMERISVMRDRHADFVYETYQYSDPDEQT